MNNESRALLALLGPAVVKDWLHEAGSAGSHGAVRATEPEATEIVQALRAGLEQGGEPGAFDARPWAALREALEALSRSRVAQGQSAADTSAFVLALKRPLFTGLQSQMASDPVTAMKVLWSATLLVDGMAQWTVSSYQRTREDVIRRQQQELLELSTPVIKLWEGVLAVPMIGTLDSARTQLVMETLLQRIVDSGAQLAIIDITGVPTVDTLVAQHLLKTVSAIRLMGAECIISGIRPQIAQTIVHLGIELQGIASKANLADALALALQQTGFSITRAGK
jgi:rsbT co-antagonist protein RsbR